MELAFAAFGAVVFCAFLTAALTRVWDSARFQLSRAIVWLVSILGVSATLTVVAAFSGGQADVGVFLIIAIAVAMVSPIAVSIFHGLSPKNRKAGGEKERLRAAGVGFGQRLEHQNRLRVGQDSR